MSTETHTWRYSQVNGFWAHCSCGYSASSISDWLLRRRMNRHAREALELQLLRRSVGVESNQETQK